MLKGLWVIKDTYPPLYTNKAADIIIEKATGKKFVRGKRKLFQEEDLPNKIEDTDKYEFIYTDNKSQGLSNENILQEILINKWLKK